MNTFFFFTHHQTGSNDSIKYLWGSIWSLIGAIFLFCLLVSILLLNFDFRIVILMVFIKTSFIHFIAFRCAFVVNFLIQYLRFLLMRVILCWYVTWEKKWLKHKIRVDRAYHKFIGEKSERKKKQNKTYVQWRE